MVGRGIDVTGVSHIINYDIPQFADDYIHRVGRTGRMGREGIAFTFVTPEEGPQLTRIEMRINRLLVRRETQDLLPSCAGGRYPVRGAPATAPGELAAEAAIEPNAAPAASRHEAGLRPAHAAGPQGALTCDGFDCLRGSFLDVLILVVEQLP